MRLIDLFDKCVSLHPERILVISGEHRVTYAEAAALSRKIANGLHGQGVRRGHKALVLSENSIAACLAILGILRAGCVLTSVETSGDPAAIAANLRRVGVSVVFYSKKNREKVEHIKLLCDELRCTVEIGSNAADAVEAHLFDGADASAEEESSLDEVATLFASGGTSGKSRNAVATHACWAIGLANLLAFAPDYGLVTGLIPPMTHISGATGFLFSTVRGATVVLMERFDPEYVCQLIATRRIGFLVVPPTALQMMLSCARSRSFDFSSLKTLIYSGAPSLVSTVVEAAEVFGPVLATTYGQTETTVSIAALSQADHRRAIAERNETLLASCGRALPMSRVEIMDPAGALLSHGEVGEIVVRGSHVMKGYYNDDKETAEVSQFGWHHTGDLGRMDEDGYLYIVDRKREMIITGGYNLFPRQIEEVLTAHPAVRECVVLGTPHDVLGEIAKAIVVLEEGQSISEVGLKSYCMAQLGPVRTPVSIEFWTDLPRTGAGKVARGAIRDGFWKRRVRRI